jgi:hypothetical protein
VSVVGISILVADMFIVAYVVWMLIRFDSSKPMKDPFTGKILTWINQRLGTQHPQEIIIVGPFSSLMTMRKSRLVPRYMLELHDSPDGSFVCRPSMRLYGKRRALIAAHLGHIAYVQKIMSYHPVQDQCEDCLPIYKAALQSTVDRLFELEDANSWLRLSRREKNKQGSTS